MGVFLPLKIKDAATEGWEAQKDKMEAWEPPQPSKKGLLHVFKTQLNLSTVFTEVYIKSEKKNKKIKQMHWMLRGHMFILKSSNAFQRQWDTQEVATFSELTLRY